MRVTNECPYCRQTMQTTRMACSSCQVTVEGDFPLSRLAELPTEHQRFIELFVLAGGSLKEIAKQAGVSYPTVRSRLDRVIETLQDAVAASQQTPAAPSTPPVGGAGNNPAGKPAMTPMSSEEAARLIKAI